MFLVLSCLSKFVTVLVLSLCVLSVCSRFCLHICFLVCLFVFCTSATRLILPVPLFVRLVPCHSLWPRLSVPVPMYLASGGQSNPHHFVLQCPPFSFFVPVHPTYFPPFLIYFCCLLFIFYSCTVCMEHPYFVYSVLFMCILSFYFIASFSVYFASCVSSSCVSVCLFFVCVSVSLLLQTEFKVEQMLYNILIVSFTLTLTLRFCIL